MTDRELIGKIIKQCKGKCNIYTLRYCICISAKFNDKVDIIFNKGFKNK